MRVIKHTCFLITISIIFAVCLLACSNESQENANLSASENTRISNENTNEFDLAEFERNRELWTSKNIQNYKMIIGAQGLMLNFPEQVLIEVQNSRAKSIKSLSQTGKNNTFEYQPYDTVEKIFNFIKQKHSKKADTLNVRYEETLGYPIKIILDEKTNWSDDELMLNVFSLEVIN